MQILPELDNLIKLGIIRFSLGLVVNVKRFQIDWKFKYNVKVRDSSFLSENIRQFFMVSQAKETFFNIIINKCRKRSFVRK